ncbi:hypothetical protein T11_17504 [Trichinella zimbabwensis]|uniref:Uncharacterized protein n=1 Tax=Trichinella zimbabwensis TaxID=268475 RepID=A0A0V1GHD6_9BILA|nr:hypothetical protein T11_17504 [Trichinella zimbabwensis]
MLTRFLRKGIVLAFMNHVYKFQNNTQIAAL